MARWFVDRLPHRGIPSVSLRRLLPDAQFVGCADWEISGCCDDHRRLEPGQLFVAVPDARPGYDGHHFLNEALERGAAGVVVERPCAAAGRLQVVVQDARTAFARICQALSGDPSRQLVTLGITGSLGKSITAVMIHSILDAAGKDFGLINRSVLSPARLGAALAGLIDRGSKGAVVEVSSAALESRSVEGIAFDAAVVTDLAGTHASDRDLLLPIRRAKAKLIRQLVPGGLAVVSADDPNAEMLGGINLKARRVAFAFEPVANPLAAVDVSARLEWMDGSGSRMVLHGFDREVAVHLRLIGSRAASCALAAATLAWGLGIDRTAVVAGLESIQTVAGYLEPVSAGQDFEVRLDSAQIPVALAEALASVRTIASGRVHCVLSSDGCADRASRRRLAAIAEMGADRVVLTLSNPRTEDPGQILTDVLAGFHQPGRVCVEPDRRLAIETAIAGARSGDAVLIAGNSRNTVQIFADRVIPFNDSAVATRWLERRHVASPARSA